VWVAGVQQAWRAPQVYALLNKPCGLLSAMSDPHGRPHIGQILPWVRLQQVMQSNLWVWQPTSTCDLHM